MSVFKRIIAVTLLLVTCGAVGYMVYTCNRLPVEETEGRTAYAIPCD